MPSSPFVGLSILVHLILIAFFKVFNLKPSKFKLKYSNSPPLIALKVAASFAILLLIFGLSTGAAWVLVKHSLEDEHSTVLFATKEIQKNQALKKTTNEIEKLGSRNFKY